MPHIAMAMAFISKCSYNIAGHNRTKPVQVFPHIEFIASYTLHIAMIPSEKHIEERQVLDVPSIKSVGEGCLRQVLLESQGLT